MDLNLSIILSFYLSWMSIYACPAVGSKDATLLRFILGDEAETRPKQTVSYHVTQTRRFNGRRPRAVNTPPVVTSPPAMKITGKGTYDITLFAQDAEGDSFEFYLDNTKPKPKYGNVTLTKKGELSYVSRGNETGEDKIYFKVNEVYTSSGPQLLSTDSALTLRLEERDSKASIVPMLSLSRALSFSVLKGSPNIPTAAPPTLKMWEIAAIIAGAALFLTLLVIGFTCCCCTFDPGNKRLPKVSPFGNHVMPQERRPSMMNPHYKPPTSSLLRRESVRSGAADGTPYYGTRKNNSWTPKPDDVPARRESFMITPSPSMQSELFVTSPPRRPSIQTIPESPRRLSVQTIPEERSTETSPMVLSKKSVTHSHADFPLQDFSSHRRSSCLSENMSVFSQVPWSSISSPTK